MDGSLLAGIGLAALASTNMNVGKGIQKWKVHVLGAGRGILAPEHRRDLSIWAGGILLTSTALIFFPLALNVSDKAALVSAANGVGLVFLVLFARVVLGEEVGWREGAGAALVLVGTVMMGYLDEGLARIPDYSIGRFWSIVAGLVLLYTPAAILSWRTGRLHGLVFGTLAGTLSGAALVLADISLPLAGHDLVAWLAYPYPYLAFLLSSIALWFTQLAFWRARALIVVPAFNACFILVPLGMEIALAGSVLVAGQYAAVVAIVAGVFLLTLRES